MAANQDATKVMEKQWSFPRIGGAMIGLGWGVYIARIPAVARVTESAGFALTFAAVMTLQAIGIMLAYPKRRRDERPS